MKVYLIAGHGSGDPGAIGNGYQEWKLAREFNDKLAKYLINLGVKVQIYNSEGSVNSTKDMYQQSLKGKGLYSFKADDRIVIETHLNSATKIAHGTELWISSALSPDKYDKAINKALGKYFTQRGIKKNSGLLNMNIAKARGINYRLVELCFISNKDDVNKLVSNMDEIAKSVAEEMTGKKIDKPIIRPKDNYIGTAWFMGEDMKECFIRIYEKDELILVENPWDKYAHKIKININKSPRDVFNQITGKKVNAWKNSCTRLFWISENLAKKMK